MRRVLLLSLTLALAPACGRSDPPPAAAVAEACSACRMAIEAPAFSARCLDTGGTPLRFDDVGCLALEILTGRLEPTAIAFRHLEEERWLAEEEAAFVRHPATPMRFGFAAVDAADGGLTFSEVCAELAERFDLPAPPSGR